LPNFNVLHDPWIPVRNLYGQPETLGILETLKRAHELRGIEDASPLVVAALHRLLLAFLYRTFKPIGVSRVIALLEANQFDIAALHIYLESIPAARFDLFGETPFYQVGDLEFEKDTSIAKLAIERSSGNNKALFDHSIDNRPPSLSIAEATRWLIAHQAFTLGGGKSSGGLINACDAPSPRGVQVLVIGFNLFKTLCGNLVPYKDGFQESDKPIWELPPITYQALKAKQIHTLNKFEFAKLFTWQSRAIKFLPVENKIDRVFYGSGWKDAGKWRDPMCAYNPPRKLDAEPSVVRFSLEKAFWRDFDALIPPDAEYRPLVLLLDERLRDDLEQEGTLQLLVLGQVTRKDAAVDDWRSEQFPLPVRFLEDQSISQKISEANQRADEVGLSISEAGKILVRCLLNLENKRLNEKQRAQLDTLLQSLPLLREYWGNLERSFRVFLVKLGSNESPELALNWWSDQILLTVKSAMKTTRKALGYRGFEIKAFLEAESKLNLELHKLHLLERFKNVGKEVKV
jgi:CRISPR system Cascade subunit CasA